MKYGSVCSGIEAATQAWAPLGWKAEFFSEIDKFPSAVLAHHYGSNMPGEPVTGNGIPNYGDMTNFKEWPDHAIDILVGGTPCQDYSVAGLRAGMAGDRGSLTLTYIEIAARYRPRWIVWENVPGVLSSNSGKDFARFLGDFSGTKIAVPKCGWKTSGIVAGDPNAYGLAYRVLDTQYVRTCDHPQAIPQRRRRVFVVGYLGDWRSAASVLLDPESLRRDIKPRRKAGQGFAAGTLRSTDGGGDVDHAQANHLIPDFSHTLRGEGFDASEDGTGRGTPIIPVAKTFDRQSSGEYGLEPVASTMSARDYKSPSDLVVPLFVPPKTEVKTPLPIAFSSKDYGGDAVEGVSPTLRASGHRDSHPNAGAPPAVAFDLRGREGGAQFEGPHDTANIRAASGGSSRSYVAESWAVRRLTPVECERLQGFPDDFTRIPWGKKTAGECPDGHRYKALGNSMSTNVMSWIGQRIEFVEGVLNG